MCGHRMAENHPEPQHFVVYCTVPQECALSKTVGHPIKANLKNVQSLLKAPAMHSTSGSC